MNVSFDSWLLLSWRIGYSSVRDADARAELECPRQIAAGERAAEVGIRGSPGHPRDHVTDRHVSRASPCPG